MKELGEFLKRTRISNGVNLEEASLDMNIPISQLENIENGNTRAFKDVYKLKQYVKIYAKYLGLDPDRVNDKFNEFLFEHTSRISLDDILAAREKNEEQIEKSKVKSPYTIIHEPKKNIFPVVIIVSIVLIILIIFILVLIGRITRTSPRIDELKYNKVKVGEII